MKVPICFSLLLYSITMTSGDVNVNDVVRYYSTTPYPADPGCGANEEMNENGQCVCHQGYSRDVNNDCISDDEFELPDTETRPGSVDHPTNEPVPSLSPCEFPKDIGSECPDNKPAGVRWYYNAGKALCLSFQYRGCGGNTNNFFSFKQCNSTCSPEDKICSGSGSEIPYGNRHCNNRFRCPRGYRCVPEVRGKCCNEQIEKKYEEGLSEVCALRFKRKRAYGKRENQIFRPLIGDTCSDLVCPFGYSCVQANELFAKCCEEDRPGSTEELSCPPCMDGSYEVRDNNGCVSCFSHREIFTNPCTNNVCPLHCQMSQADQRGCRSCSCSRHDEKQHALYTFRYEIANVSSPDIDTNEVCVDIRVKPTIGRRRFLLLNTAVGKIYGEFSHVENHGVPFVNFSQSSRMARNAAVWMDNFSMALDTTVRRREACPCTQSEPVLPHVLLNPEMEGIENTNGLLGHLASKLKGAKLSRVQGRTKLTGRRIRRGVKLIRRMDALTLQPYSCYSVSMNWLVNINQYEQKHFL